MPTDRTTVDFLVDQAGGAGVVSARAMFGAYGLSCYGKMVGIIGGESGDAQLFLKPTPGGRALAPDAEEAPPYPGAKPCLLIDPDRWDDREWMSEIVRVTAMELPAPKPKPAKKRG